MRVLVRISPILLFPDRFRVKPYPSKQKKVGENLPLKDKSAWACLLGKMVHFWEPWKQAFWPSPEYREPPICSQGIPCQVLWSGMLRLGRGGQQQLRLKNHQALVSPSEHKLIRQTMPDELFNKTRQSDLRWKAETNI